MKKEIKNLPASIHSNLNQRAKETNTSFQEIFHYYAMERFLNRLSQSRYRSNFVLKGGLAFWGWGIMPRRLTRDIDFQVYAENNVEEMEKIIKDVCSIRNEKEDGMIFDASSVLCETIMVDSDYEGVRVRFKGYLGKAYVWLQVDTSFGNVITPKEVRMEYPSILNMPSFELKGYNPETAIAEKLQAMIFLGSLNDRMKDFYDIYLLAQECDFDGTVLVEAFAATFKNRKTTLPSEVPVSLTDDFVNQKQLSWRQFTSRTMSSGTRSNSLVEVIAELRKFLLPPLMAAAEKKQFEFQWKAGQAWSLKL